MKRDKYKPRWYDPHKIQRIIECTCEVSGIPKDLLLSGTRVNGGIHIFKGETYRNVFISDFKHIVAYLCLKHTDISLPQLKVELRMRNHTSILYMKKKVQDALYRAILTGEDDRIVKDLHKIEKIFESGYNECPIIAEAKRLVGLNTKRLVA